MGDNLEDEGYPEEGGVPQPSTLEQGWRSALEWTRYLTQRAAVGVQRATAYATGSRPTLAEPRPPERPRPFECDQEESGEELIPEGRAWVSCRIVKVRIDSNLTSELDLLRIVWECCGKPSDREKLRRSYLRTRETNPEGVVSSGTVRGRIIARPGATIWARCYDETIQHPLFHLSDKALKDCSTALLYWHYYEWKHRPSELTKRQFKRLVDLYAAVALYIEARQTNAPLAEVDQVVRNKLALAREDRIDLDCKRKGLLDEVKDYTYSLEDFAKIDQMGEVALGETRALAKYYGELPKVKLAKALEILAKEHLAHARTSEDLRARVLQQLQKAQATGDKDSAESKQREVNYLEATAKEDRKKALTVETVRKTLTDAIAEELVSSKNPVSKRVFEILDDESATVSLGGNSISGVYSSIPLDRRISDIHDRPPPLTFKDLTDWADSYLREKGGSRYSPLFMKEFDVLSAAADTWAGATLKEWLAPSGAWTEFKKQYEEYYGGETGLHMRVAYYVGKFGLGLLDFTGQVLSRPDLVIQGMADQWALRYQQFSSQWGTGFGSGAAATTMLVSDMLSTTQFVEASGITGQKVNREKLLESGINIGLSILLMGPRSIVRGSFVRWKGGVPPWVVARASGVPAAKPPAGEGGSAAPGMRAPKAGGNGIHTGNGKPPEAGSLVRTSSVQPPSGAAGGRQLPFEEAETVGVGAEQAPVHEAVTGIPIEKVRPHIGDPIENYTGTKGMAGGEPPEVPGGSGGGKKKGIHVEDSDFNVDKTTNTFNKSISVEIGGKQAMQAFLSSLSEDGTLSLAVEMKLVDLSAETLFDQAMQWFGQRVRRIAGKWVPSMPDNLLTFNRLTAKGFSYEEAALGTWTGKMAKKYGFTKVRFSKDPLGSPGNCTDVEVIFERP